MDTEGWRITAETAAIRGRGWLRLGVRVGGIALLVVGAAALFGIELWTGYRSLWPTVVEPSEGTLVYGADFAMVVLGAAIANFV